jgi:GWxTD domain-containing protein
VFEVATLRPSRHALLLGLALFGAGCGNWQRVGSPETPATTPEEVTRIFDPTAVYQQMGLMAEAGDIPFVGVIRLLATVSPDSALAVVALSFQNRGLTFRRESSEFVAEYRVELLFRDGTRVARQVVRDERVRVSTFRETLRAEESVIFQQFIPVQAGQYVLTVVVRDRNGPNSSRYEQIVTVPRFSAPAIATPVTVYMAEPRDSAGEAPSLVVNPRSSVAYGTDSLRFYIESYQLPAGTALLMTVHDAAGRSVWQDSSRVTSREPLRGVVVALPPGLFPMGRYELRISLGEGSIIAATPFLVAFSDQWAVANLEEIVSLLRYFASPDSLRALLNAPLEERAERWERFWRRTDPNPVTPENEALDEYFSRLQSANQRFREEGVPGWLTDRGEVFVTLGEPDEMVDRRPDIPGRGRVIYWVYNAHRLTLAFVDDNGFGRFRLDARSRSEYLRVLNRIRANP